MLQKILKKNIFRYFELSEDQEHIAVEYCHRIPVFKGMDTYIVQDNFLKLELTIHLMMHTYF